MLQHNLNELNCVKIYANNFQTNRVEIDLHRIMNCNKFTSTLIRFINAQKELIEKQDISQDVYCHVEQVLEQS